LTLDGSELFKNFGCVSFCFRELWNTQYFASHTIYNIVVLFRFGRNYIISKCQIFKTLELSVKSGKYSTSTLSLVISRVRFFKNLHKNTLAFNGRGEFSEFHPVFPFSWVPPLPLYIFSVLLPVQLL
jgi:hypothetical protein